MTTRAQRRERRRTRRRTATAALRVGLAFGAVAITGLALSSAAYTDRANLNLGGAGIGFDGRFDIGVVLPDGTVEQADGPTGYDWIVAGAEELVPGHSVTTEIPVFNNTERLAADTTVSVVLRNGDGTVAPGVPNITSFLRFSAVDDAGTTLFTDATWDQAHASLGALEVRGAAALAQGDAYVAGQVDSARTVTLTIAYRDDPGVEDYNGGQAALAVRFDAASERP
ncbi:hypothetical protein [Microbacterium sp. SORGH_AS_0888]|uniref:hypothetical protein n=1 Tax=Microbacterium sp. SORGH_AS_0888 TaxID=3041791 RepID=UPI002780E880|nr:hypothetical protein [Microbacterium sp. SORGH_AS_0888]MDQ1129963.1 hypothetical protein [Microbacterium sp. SORGH_AS_0888]